MSVCEFAGCRTTLDEMCKKLWVPRGKIFHRTFWRLPKTMKSIFLVRHRFTTTKFILFNAKIPFDEK